MATEASASPLGFFTPVVIQGESKPVHVVVGEALDSLFTWGSRRVVIMGGPTNLSETTSPVKCLVCPYIFENTSSLITAWKIAAYAITLVAVVALIVPARVLVIPATLVTFCRAIRTAFVVAFCAKSLFRLELSQYSMVLAKKPPPYVIEEIRRQYPNGRTQTENKPSLTQLPCDRCSESVSSWRSASNPSWIFATSNDLSDLSAFYARILVASAHGRRFNLLEVSAASEIRVGSQRIIAQEDPSMGYDLDGLYWGLRNADLSEALAQYVRFVVDKGVSFLRVSPLASSEAGLALVHPDPCSRDDAVSRMSDLIGHLYSEAQIDSVIRQFCQYSFVGDPGALHEKKSEQRIHIEGIRYLMQFYEAKGGVLHDPACPIQPVANADWNLGFPVKALGETISIPQSEHAVLTISKQELIHRMVDAINAKIAANTSTFAPNKRQVRFSVIEEFGVNESEYKSGMVQKQTRYDRDIDFLLHHWVPQILEALRDHGYIYDFQRLDNTGTFGIQA